MEWKKDGSGSIWRMNKEKLIFVFCSGLLLFVLSMPGTERERSWEAAAVGSGELENADGTSRLLGGAGAGLGEETLPGLSGGAQASSGGVLYEKELEQRIAALLDRVEGVGKADVMVVLRSSEERVFHVDKTSRTSATEEKGGDGRTVREQEISESTVMGGGNQGPVVEKELTPEVSGIVISADGGGNASVRAEISEAMEALFGLPAHKIKVLKRVKEGV